MRHLTPQELSTGRYTLADVRCRTCRTRLGWKYLKAENPDQKYKEGAVLLQQAALRRINCLGLPNRPPAQLPRVWHQQVQTH